MRKIAIAVVASFALILGACSSIPGFEPNYRKPVDTEFSPPSNTPSVPASQAAPAEPSVDPAPDTAPRRAEPRRRLPKETRRPKEVKVEPAPTPPATEPGRTRPTVFSRDFWRPAPAQPSPPPEETTAPVEESPVETTPTTSPPPAAAPPPVEVQEAPPPTDTYPARWSWAWWKAWYRRL